MPLACADMCNFECVCLTAVGAAVQWGCVSIHSFTACLLASQWRTSLQAIPKLFHFFSFSLCPWRWHLAWAVIHLLLQAVFFGLLTDLFPSIDPPRLVSDSLNACVREVCEDMNLWPDDALVLKVNFACTGMIVATDYNSG